MEPIQLVIGGKTVKTARNHAIHNPSTGEVVGLMPLADEADLNRAVGAASAAFNTWKDITDSERADAGRYESMAMARSSRMPRSAESSSQASALSSVPKA